MRWIDIYYITTKRVSTLQTNACSYSWVTQQTVDPALGLCRPGAATAGWSNPAPNRGLYFINIDQPSQISFNYL